MAGIRSFTAFPESGPKHEKEEAMGGHISLGIRREDGSFSTTGVWTNPMKWIVQDERFMEGSLEPVDEFLKRYLSTAEEPDADYGPQETIPGEYGFILIDAVDRVVMNFNHYSKLSVPRLADLGIDPSGDNGEFLIESRPEDIEYRDFVRKYLAGVQQIYSETGEVVDIPFEKFLDDRALTSFTKTLHRDEFTWMTRFRLASPFWTLKELDWQSSKDFRSLWKQVKRCTRMTDDERRAWEKEHRDVIRIKKGGAKLRRRLLKENAKRQHSV
jgi:hypothetical protein